MSGRRIVEMVKEDLRMSQILTREAFENAIRTNAAIRWLDQCGDPPDRHCRAHGCEAGPGTTGTAWAPPCPAC